MVRGGWQSQSSSMPELPEVETTRRGIRPHLLGCRVSGVVVRQRQLRWPVPPELEAELPGRVIREVGRRAKYLLLQMAPAGTVLLHLGMSGNLRVIPAPTPVAKHDHVDLVLDDGSALRFTDPRRFGICLWLRAGSSGHPLLRNLGPEPLGPDLTADYLHARARRRRSAVKAFLMDSRIVCGVGNIYANEALFHAGIHPLRAAGNISRRRYAALVEAVRAVLEAALVAGGTTLRDFRDASGRPGYFSAQLAVYGRNGEPCLRCGRALKLVRAAQRSTYYCPRCQR